MRPIDADALSVRLLDATYYDSQDEDIVWQMVQDAPTIDAEIVKHGRWLPQILLGERVWDCSECKTMGSPHWKRCPVCEAKMDGGEEHEGLS